jgi:3-dehydroquinate dehydratase II
MRRFLVINGPNLNALGKRDKAIYGSASLMDLETEIRQWASVGGFEVECRQSNHEGILIDWIQEVNEGFDGLVINAGALTHYSYAIRDAISDLSKPSVEVHISNIHAREEFRHKSVLAPVVTGQILGLGFEGYRLALQYLNHQGEQL